MASTNAVSCPDNEAAFRRLAAMAQRCLVTKRETYRMAVMKAMKSVKKYPLPILSEEEAMMLEGVGPALAAEIMQAISKKAPHTEILGVAATCSSSAGGGGILKKKKNREKESESSSHSESVLPVQSPCFKSPAAKKSCGRENRQTPDGKLYQRGAKSKHTVSHSDFDNTEQEMIPDKSSGGEIDVLFSVAAHKPGPRSPRRSWKEVGRIESVTATNATAGAHHPTEEKSNQQQLGGRDSSAGANSFAGDERISSASSSSAGSRIDLTLVSSLDKLSIGPPSNKQRSAHESTRNINNSSSIKAVPIIIDIPDSPEICTIPLCERLKMRRNGGKPIAIAMQLQQAVEGIEIVNQKTLPSNLSAASAGAQKSSTETMKKASAAAAAPAPRIPAVAITGKPPAAAAAAVTKTISSSSKGAGDYDWSKEYVGFTHSYDISSSPSPAVYAAVNKFSSYSYTGAEAPSTAATYHTSSNVQNHPRQQPMVVENNYADVEIMKPHINKSSSSSLQQQKQPAYAPLPPPPSSAPAAAARANSKLGGGLCSNTGIALTALANYENKDEEEDDGHDLDQDQDQTQGENHDPDKIVLKGGVHAWEPVLLVDTREKDHNLIQTRMIESGIACEVCTLALGDFMWAARRKEGVDVADEEEEEGEDDGDDENMNPQNKQHRRGGGGDITNYFTGQSTSVETAITVNAAAAAGKGSKKKTAEGGGAAAAAGVAKKKTEKQKKTAAVVELVVLDTIAERKTTADLASSIVDGRYAEQKRRLLECGLATRLYIVEGLSLAMPRQSAVTTVHLKSAMVSTQINYGMRVVRTRGLDHTVSMIISMHGQVSKRFYKGQCGGPTSTYLPLSAFQSRHAKKGVSTAKQALILNMRAIPGVSAPAAMAIGERFSTIARFNNFLKDAMSDYTAKAELSNTRKLGGTAQKLGPRLAANIYRLMREEF